MKVGDNSRSAWVFDAVCALIRCDVPDEEIFTILTDRGWGISESIIEKGANAEKYAIRQIERAKEEVVSPELRELNDRHAWVSLGSKEAILNVVTDGGGEHVEFLTRATFKGRYENRRVFVGTSQNGKPVEIELGAWWLKHPQRRQFDRVVFSPEASVPGAYNLWKDFGVRPVPGDWSLMRDLLKELTRTEEGLNYVLSWAAWAIQNPGKQAEAVIVFQGGQGTGKSTFGRALKRIDLKALWDYGTYIVVIGIWAENNLLIHLNPDLAGRIEEVSIYWSDAELRRVLQVGSEALNVSFAQNIENRLVSDSFGTVGILQRLALGTLDEHGGMVKADGERRR